MTAPTDVQELGRDRRRIDLRFRGTPGLIGSYLLPLGDGWAMVETGPARCRAPLLAGLEAAGIDRSEIRQVFVTHIHLDHAGGLGAVQEDLPRATFYAHAQGVPHLVAPAKLDASARRAWGPVYDEILGGLTPVDPARIRPLTGGEEFPLRGGLLRVLDTPGHARHHLSFFDTATRAMLTGDAAGVRLRGSDRARPAVPPPDLDLDHLDASVRRMIAEEPGALWYTHYGPYPGGREPLEEYRQSVRQWAQVARAALEECAEGASVAERLREFELQRIGPGAEATIAREDLVSGTEMAAMGLVRYLTGRPRADGGAR